MKLLGPIIHFEPSEMPGFPVIELSPSTVKLTATLTGSGCKDGSNTSRHFAL